MQESIFSLLDVEFLFLIFFPVLLNHTEMFQIALLAPFPLIYTYILPINFELIGGINRKGREERMFPLPGNI